MRVLVLGANGFVGSAIVGALIQAGIEVRAFVRDPDKVTRRFPQIEAIRVDLRDAAVRVPAYWHPALDQVDAVINAAGVLQPRREDDAWAIHCLAATSELSPPAHQISAGAVSAIEGRLAKVSYQAASLGRPFRQSSAARRKSR